MNSVSLASHLPKCPDSEAFVSEERARIERMVDAVNYQVSRTDPERSTTGRSSCSEPPRSRDPEDDCERFEAIASGAVAPGKGWGDTVDTATTLSGALP